VHTMNSQKSSVLEIFAAVFSQKPAVSMKRVSILQAINKCSEGKMRFRDVFREIQSDIRDTDYTSVKLTYDLRILRKYGLISQTWNGEYTITENGCTLLDMYQEMTRRIGDPNRIGKTGFKGEVNGQIVGSFDLNTLGEALARIALFRKKFKASRGKLFLELKDDDDNFFSEIEVQESGFFSVRVILFRDDRDQVAGVENFLSDFEKPDEWYETARAITQTIAYFVKRTVRKLWRDSKVDLPLKPDSYPV
jgi:predicted transcriptional regulator